MASTQHRHHLSIIFSCPSKDNLYPSSFTASSQWLPPARFNGRIPSGRATCLRHSSRLAIYRPLLVLSSVMLWWISSMPVVTLSSTGTAFGKLSRTAIISSFPFQLVIFSVPPTTNKPSTCGIFHLSPPTSVKHLTFLCISVSSTTRLQPWASLLGMTLWSTAIFWLLCATTSRRLWLPLERSRTRPRQLATGGWQFSNGGL